MGKDEISQAEDKANVLLDTFIEDYLNLHNAIHHRKPVKDKNRLKKDYPDIYSLDEITERSLYKFATYINKLNKADKSKK
ncbi:MAG TPA: hypothetical protein VK674_05680 [Candidatus Limnocylindria bacterium]|nr:hypothetical protein [Candidatus Limnocylindria bacterium]